MIGAIAAGAVAEQTLPLDVEYLVIAGGGGGGAFNNYAGGGGGAGGYKTATLTGLAKSTNFTITVGAGGAGGEASVTYAIKKMAGYEWLGTSVNIAILAGFSSVILVMLMGQTRVFYSMSNDGLLPKLFSVLHPKFKTPYKSNVVLLIMVGSFAAFIPGSVAGNLTSFGTLFAFVIVCAGIIMMRKNFPDLERPFKTPLVPLVPILGIISCLAMMFALPGDTWLRLFIWLGIGFVIYFIYGIKHSKLNNK